MPLSVTLIAEEFFELVVGQRKGSARPGAGQLADFGARDAAGAQGHAGRPRG